MSDPVLAAMQAALDREVAGEFGADVPAPRLVRDEFGGFARDPDGTPMPSRDVVPGTIVQIDPAEDVRAGAAAVVTWLIRRARRGA